MTDQDPKSPDASLQSDDSPARLSSPWFLTAIYVAVVFAWRLAVFLTNLWTRGLPEGDMAGRLAEEALFIVVSGGLVYLLAARIPSNSTRPYGEAQSQVGLATRAETPPANDPRALLDQMSDPGYLLDRRGRFLHANPALAAMTGMALSELVGRSYEPLVADMDSARVRSHFQAACRGESQSYVAHGRKPDGSPYAVQVLNIPYRKGERVEAVIGIARDITEELARPDQLTDSEIRYRAVFEHTPYAMILTDPETKRVLDTNAGATRMFGLARGELLALHKSDLLDLEDPEVREFFEQRERDGVASGVLELKCPDGRTLAADVTGVLYRDPDGSPRGMFIARDLSAEQAREHQYFSLFEHSLDGILLVTVDGEVEAANPAALDLFGMSLDELKRRGRKGVVAPDDTGMEKLLADRERKGSGRAVVRYLRGDGSEFRAEVSSSLFRNEAGELRATIIFRDISERIKREERLAESEGRFRALFEHSPDAILVIEPETGRNIDANPAAEALFGLSREDILQRSREDDTDTSDPAVQRFIEERRSNGHARVTTNMIRGDGTLIPVDVTSSIYRDAEGRLTACNLIRDISEQRRLMRELEDHQQVLEELSETQRAILDALPAHIALLDESGRVRYVNAAWQRFAEENGIAGNSKDIGANYLEVADRAARRGLSFAGKVSRAIRDIIAGELNRFDAEYDCHGPTEERWFREVITPYRRGSTRGAVVAHLDVTDRLLAERQLELMAATFRHADEALLICNDRFVILEANDTYLELTGLSREDALGVRPGFLDIGEQGKAVLQGLEQDGQWQGELLQKRANGKVFTSRASVSEINGRDAGSRFLVVNFEDISALRDIERKVDYLSFHDALTGLPNRLAMEQWFTQYGRNGRTGTPLSLVYLDLDHFKAINESYGHGTGDRLLGEVADRIKDFCELQDYAVRLGGDDFILLLSGIHHAEQVTDRVGRLLSRLAEPYGPAGRKMYVTASAGVAVYPEHGRDLETLLRRADAAHAEIKTRGRGQMKIYSAAMHESVERKAIIESHLHDAIRNGELSLNYQPFVNLADGRVLGFEALARWHNPDLGMVAPGQFIPVAEASGFITELGAWVFDTACRELRQWLDAGLDLDVIAVNVSPVQFQDPGLPDQIRAALDRHGLEGSRLRVEITESVLVIDPERTKRVLDRLREFGIEIAVDDFGTGYSSMAYLRHFPAQAIKLDQAFVKGLPGSRTDASIVNSVLTLSRDLGMTLIAEGVETAEQRDYLLERGCDRAQGFFFSLPLRSEDVAWLLEHHPTLPVSETGEDS